MAYSLAHQSYTEFVKESYKDYLTFSDLKEDAIKETKVQEKFETICNETAKELFDVDVSSYVTYGIGYSALVPSKANTGQYADPKYPLTFKIPNNTTVFYTSKCPENGHELKQGCSECYKPYMDLFSENIGENYCRCHG